MIGTEQKRSETSMRRSVQLSVMLLSIAWLAATAGCGTAAPRQQLDWKRVTVTDPSQVAGKWEGLLRRTPPVRTDPVTVVIASDGRFRFSGEKTLGLLSGDGSITVAEGRLTATTEKESATLTLYEADNQRMLNIKGQSTDGLVEFEANLTPD
jgi:hypothetical protein